MRFRPTKRAYVHFGTTSLTSGGVFFGAVASVIILRGTKLRDWLLTGCLPRMSFIPGRVFALPSNTQGGSPVRELRTPGSVRGVLR